MNDYDPDLEFHEKRQPAPAVELDPAKVQHYVDLLRTQQNLSLAVVAGAAGAAVGTAIWVAVTITTGYQIGWMAVGVGFLTGLAIRLTGKGIDSSFGIAGAAFALLGCAVGNLIVGCWLLAEATEDAGFFEMLTGLTPGLIATIFKATFNPIDLLFYGLAAAAGYRFSIRRVRPRDLAHLAVEPGQTYGRIESETDGENWAA